MRKAATQAMGEAFDAACKSLHDLGQPKIVYEVIAHRIIEAAKRGERDPNKLLTVGLAGLGLDADSKRASWPIRGSGTVGTLMRRRECLGARFYFFFLLSLRSTRMRLLPTFLFAGELSEMGSEALVKLALLPIAHGSDHG